MDELTSRLSKKYNVAAPKRKTELNDTDDLTSRLSAKYGVTPKVNPVTRTAVPTATTQRTTVPNGVTAAQMAGATTRASTLNPHQRESDLQEVIAERNKPANTLNRVMNALAFGTQNTAMRNQSMHNADETPKSTAKADAYKQKYNVDENTLNNEIADYKHTQDIKTYEANRNATDWQQKSMPGQYKSATDDPLELYLNPKQGDNNLYTDDAYANDWTQIMRKGEEQQWGYITDAEKQMYYYVLNSQGRKPAEDYLKSLSYDFAKRANTEQRQKIDNASVPAKIAYNIASVPASVQGGMYAAAEDAANLITGQKINPYSQAHLLQNTASNVRESTNEAILGDDPNMGRKVLSHVYNAAMSTADSLFGMVSLGNAYTYTMGLGAASQRAKELYEQGASNEQIILGSLASGIAESFFEKFSLENLMSIGASESLGKAIKSLLKQAGIEASEEFNTEIANKITDTLIRGNDSDMLRQYRQYLDEGMNKAQATKAVLTNAGTDIVTAAIDGALSGLLGAGISTGTQTAASAVRGSEINAKGNAANLIADVQNRFANEENSEAKAMADKYAERIASGKKTTNLRTGALYDTAVQEAFDNARGNKLSYADIRKQYDEIAGKSTTEIGKEERAKNARAIRRVLEGNASNADLRYVENDRIAQQIIQNERNAEYEREYEARYTESMLTANAYTKRGEGIKGELSSERRAEIAKPTLESIGNKLVGIAKTKSVENGKIVAELTNGKERTIDTNKMQDETAKAVWTEAQKLKSPEAVDAFVSGYTGGNVDTYSRAFQNMYQLGITNIGYDEAAEAGSYSVNYLGQEAAETAYALGVSDTLLAKEIGYHDMTSAEFGSQKQKKLQAQGQILESFAKKYGLSLVLIDRLADKNGLYKTGTNQIILSAQAEGSLLTRTAGHEAFHYIETTNKEAAAELTDYVYNYFVDTKGQEWVDNFIQDNYGAKGYDNDQFKSEFAADQMFNVFTSDAAINNLVAENRSISQKIADHLKQLVADIRNWVNSLAKNGKFEDMQTLLDDADTLETIANKFFDALNNADTSQLSQVPESREQIIEELADNGITVTDDNTVSMSSMRAFGGFNENGEFVVDEAKVKEIAEWMSEATGMSKQKCKGYLDDNLSLTALVLQDRRHLEYEPDDFYSAFKSNSEYWWGAIDFNTNCPKRVYYTAVYDTLQKMFPNRSFDQWDLAALRNILQENDIPVACGLCFVEDRRQQLGKIATEYIKMVKESQATGKTITKTNTKGERTELHVTKKLENQWKDILGVQQNDDIVITDDYVPNQYDLGTYEGFANLRANHPQIAMGYIAFNNSRGQASGRLIEGEAEYKRQLLDLTKAQVDTINDHGGLRIFSFSDFEASHAIDLVQIIEDCAAKGIKIQAYTKQVSFARMVENTNVKLNLSRIPAGIGYKEVAKGTPNAVYQNGKWYVLTTDNREGIPTDVDNYIDTTKNKNIGNVIVGINPEQIRIAMKSKWIDFIIPFHTNQTRAVLAIKGVSKKWRNYRKVQNDKIKATGKNAKENINIYTDVINKHGISNEAAKARGITAERMFTEAFLYECANHTDKDGKAQPLIPRFSEFLEPGDIGGYGYTEGYYKFLVDYKLFDSNGNMLEQKVVVPKFDMAYMNEMIEAQRATTTELEKMKPKMDSVIEQYAALIRTGALDANGALRKEMIASAKNPKNDVVDVKNLATFKASSQRGADTDSSGRELSEQQKEYFADSVVRDDQGRLLRLYHGTEEAGFTVFNNLLSKVSPTVENGFFFTDSPLTAYSYSGSSDTFSPDRNAELPEDSFPANYEAYLNITNPLIIDGKGSSWDQVFDFYDDVEWVGANDLTDEQVRNAAANIAVNYGWDELEDWDSEDVETLREMLPGGNEDPNYGDIYGVKDGDDNVYMLNPPQSTRDYVDDAIRGGYDGVIFRNINDNGGHVWQIGNADVYVAINANQIKSVNNTEPTDNEDIRFSTRRGPEIEGQITFGDQEEEPQEMSFDDSIKRLGLTYTNGILDKMKNNREKIDTAFDNNPEMLFAYRFATNDEKAKADLKNYLNTFDDIIDLRIMDYVMATYGVWQLNDMYRENERGRALTEKLERANAGYDELEKAISKVRGYFTRRITALKNEKAERGETRGRDIGMKGKVYSAREIQEIFNRINTDEESQALADKVFDVCDKLGVRFKADTNYREVGGTQAGLRVRYNLNWMKDVNVPDERKAKTILHEAIHAVTSYYLTATPGAHMTEMYEGEPYQTERRYHLTNSADRYTLVSNQYDNRYGDIEVSAEVANAITTLRKIYESVVDDPDFGNWNTNRNNSEYGTKNVYEFTAELSNPTFREKLKQKGLWESIKDAIKKIFGISTNRYDAAAKALDSLLDNYDSDIAERYNNHYRRTLFSENKSWQFSSQRTSEEDLPDDYWDSLIPPEIREDIYTTLDELYAEKTDLMHAVNRRLNRNKINAIAGKYYNDYKMKGKVDRTEFTDAIERLYSRILNSNEVTWDDAMTEAIGIFKDALGRLTENGQEKADELLDSYGLGKHPSISISEKAFDELVARDELKGIRKYFKWVYKQDRAGRVHNAAPGTMNVHDLFNDESSVFGQMGIGELDQVFTLRDIYQEYNELKNSEVPLYSEDDLEAESTYLAAKLLEQYFDVPEAPSAELKRIQRTEKAATGTRYDKLKAKYLNTVEEMREQFAEEKKAIAEETEKKLAEYRAERTELQQNIADLTEQKKNLLSQMESLSQSKNASDRERKAAQEQAKELQDQIDSLTRQIENEKAKVKRRDEKIIREKAKQKAIDERKLARRNETVEKNKQRAQIKKTAAKITDKLLTNDNIKHVPESLKRPVLDFCQLITESGTFDRAKTDKLLDAYSNLNPDQKNPPEGLEELYSFYDAEIRDSIAELKRTLDENGATRLSELTAAQLKQVKDIVKAVHHIIVSANKAFSKNLNEDIHEYQADAYNELFLLRDNKKRFKTAFQTGNLKPVQFFDLLQSATLRELYNNIRNGELDWARVVEQAKAKREAEAAQYNYNDWKNDKLSVEVTDNNMNKKTVELTIDEALALYATYNRTAAQGQDHLLKGGFILDKEADKKLRHIWDKNKRSDDTKKVVEPTTNVRGLKLNITQEELLDLFSKLTPEQKAYANNLIQYMSNDMAALGNDVSMRLYGIRKFNEDYYYPISTSQNYIYSRGGSIDNIDNRIKQMSMTKKTTPHANNPVNIGSFTETVMRHCSDMGLYYGLCLPLEDFNRVYNFVNKEDINNQVSIKDLIQTKYGDHANSYIKQLQTDINGSHRDRSGAFVNRMVSLGKKNAVFGSLSVAVQQPSSIGRAMQYIAPKYLAQTTFSKRDYDELKRYAPVATVKEMGYFDTSVGRQAVDWMTQDNPENLIDKAKSIVTNSAYRDEILSKLPSLMDEITWSHLWNAVKAEIADTRPELEVGSPEYYQACADRFTYIVDRTQVYDSVFSRSEWMRSKDSGMSIATAFMAEPLTAANMLYASAINTAEAINRNEYSRAVKTFGRTVGAFLASVTLNSVLKSIITTLRHRDKDDKDSFWEDYIAELVKNLTDEGNPFNLVPYFSDFISLIEGYSSDRMDTQALQNIADTVKAIRTGKSPEEIAKQVAFTFGMMTGVPVKNLYRDISAFKNAVTSSFHYVKGEGNKTTASGIKDAIQGNTTKDKTRDMVDYYLDGKMDKYQKARENLKRENAASVKSQITAYLLERYMADKIDEAQVRRVLINVYGMSSKNVEKKIQEFRDRKNGTYEPKEAKKFGE